jgi:hypothetical protein
VAVGVGLACAPRIKAGDHAVLVGLGRKFSMRDEAESRVLT